MDKIDDENTTASAATAGSSSRVDAFGSAIHLSFPSSFEEPNLSSLRDNHSAYAAVAKTCLQLNQYALNGSSSAMEDVNSVQSSTLFHDTSFVNSMGGENGAFAALMECIQTHDDRRAKIVACKTLALVARAAYARIRSSPHLFAIRDSTNTRLEDEVCTDVPMALIGVALEDLDDGVAASAISALGIMTLSSSSTPGTLVDDELLREVMSMVHGHPSPHAPSLGALQDEDTNIPQMVLQSRIFDNVVSPRLMQLVCRVTSFDSQQHVRIILPTLTASLVHLSKTAPPVIYGMDRTTYAKRWLEYDFVNLMKEVVEALLLPTMKSSLDAQLAYASAMSSIRLINACPHAPWVPSLCHWAIAILKEEVEAVESLEAKLTAIASLLVCCRAVPFPERLPTLEFVFSNLHTLPSTTMAPYGITSPGLLLEYRGLSHYRRPARVAFLTEVALSFFIDGPVESDNARALSLESFLKSTTVVDSIDDLISDEDVARLGEEVVAAFCNVAIKAGRHMRNQEGERSSNMVVTLEHFHEWARMSLAVLKAFLPCISWEGSSSVFMEEELKVLVAAQTSYVGLLKEVLHAGGLLLPTSVSLKMAPTASPPNMLWDHLEETSTYLGKEESIAPFEKHHLDAIAAIAGEIVRSELKGRGIISHHMRIFLLSLATDHWIQSRFLAMHGGQKDLKDKMAKELLLALSPRRIFGKLVESNKTQIDHYSKKKKESYKKYAQETITVCVACIENIALFVCDWKKRFGKSAETTSILSNSIASLQGRADNYGAYSVLPVCKSAVDRIQATIQSSKGPPESTSLSLLIPPGPLKRRPVVTASRSQQNKDAYNIGYLMQISRQIIASRIDNCLLSYPPAHTFRGAARKQNWLRLALPPLPPSKDQKVSIKNMPRFGWDSHVSSMSGGSDAAAMTLAYSMRRGLRYDGENEFRLMISMRVHNITAVEVPEGIRLELGILCESAPTSSDSDDPASKDVFRALADTTDEVFSESTLASAVALYKPELKSGDHITWEVTLGVLPMTGVITLNPAIVYRSMEEEPLYATWVGGDSKSSSGDGESSSAGKGSVGKGPSDDPGGAPKEHITIPGLPMHLSPMVGLQPCPFVFFRDGSGDVDTFRFLWSRVPYQVPPLKITVNDDHSETAYQEIRLAAISTIRFDGEAIPGGFVTKLWAFISMNGKRALFVMAESENDKTIHIRGDDKSLLSCLVGTKGARRSIVGGLEPGMQPLE